MKRIPKSLNHLSVESKKLYREILNDYAFDNDADLKILRVALEAFDRCQAARLQIEREGMTIFDKYNQTKPHPLLPVERDSRAAFLHGLKCLKLESGEDKRKPGRPSGFERFKIGKG